MAGWAPPPENREQLVLFADKLDNAIPPQAPVRYLDEILAACDFNTWEAAYDLRRGQPPIHPRILAGILLYGLLCRLRATRTLENACHMRLDFRWLAHGFCPDHTTLSEFRLRHAEALKHLFQQVVQVAQRLGLVSLHTLAFDGTRVAANNRRSGTRTPEELRQELQELEQRFEQHWRETLENDARDEWFGAGEPPPLSPELQQAAQRRERITAVLADLEQQKACGGDVPARVPIVDLDARVMKNKEGGFAPNYTPTATVDVDSGLIVQGEVLNSSCEEHRLLHAVDEVEREFGVRPAVVLADGLLGSGHNLAGLEERGITFYSPVPGEPSPPPVNPARRADLTQPVAAELIPQLPTECVNAKKQQYVFAKEAFVFVEEEDAYYCPQGKRLNYRNTSPEPRRQGTVERRRYQSQPVDCAACPLKQMCLRGDAKTRTTGHDQHEGVRQRHAQRMAQPAAQEAYQRRRHAGETPFAWIKHRFGLRRFLVRGLARVTCEWRWALIGFNLCKLIGRMTANGARAGPATAT